MPADEKADRKTADASDTHTHTHIDTHMDTHIDTHVDKFVGVLVLMRHARHIVGSPESHMFQLASELSGGLRFVKKALSARRPLNHSSCDCDGSGAGSSRSTKRSSGRSTGRCSSSGGQTVCATATNTSESVFKMEEESWDSQLTRMWSVDVPLSAGSFGFLGANLRPTARLELAETSSNQSAGCLAPLFHRCMRSTPLAPGVRYIPHPWSGYPICCMPHTWCGNPICCMQYACSTATKPQGTMATSSACKKQVAHATRQHSNKA